MDAFVHEALLYPAAGRSGSSTSCDLVELRTTDACTSLRLHMSQA